MERLNKSEPLTSEEAAIEQMMDNNRRSSMKSGLGKFMQIAAMMDEINAQTAIGHEPPKQHVRESPKVGRNEPCPCGSGKKNKNCCKK